MNERKQPEFNENLTVHEIMEGGIICPVCEDTDRFYVGLLEVGIYKVIPGEEPGETAEWDQEECGDTIGLLDLSCRSCGFTLLSRTPREAIYIEDSNRRS